jgi:ATP/maltotriose-dependent transcriptional regulator MalT
LAWSVENDETPIGQRLARGLLFFWQVYGSVSEGLAWTEQVLAMPGGDEPTAGRAWVLLAAVYLEVMHGDVEAGWARCQDALRIARQTDEPLLEWLAIQFAAVNRLGAGDLESADDFARQSAELGHRLGERPCEGAGISGRASIACEQADYDRAEALGRHMLDLVHGDAWLESQALGYLGCAALGRKSVAEAKSPLEAGLSIVRREGEPPLITPAIFNLLAEVDSAEGHVDEARSWLTRSLELQQRGGERYSVPPTLESFAALAARQGQLARAVRLGGAADAVYQYLGARRSPAETQKRAQWLTPSRQQLGADLADRVWAEGAALDLDAAIALALGGESAAEPAGSTQPLPLAGVLTAREHEVVALVARGLTNREIADELVISAHTAQRHVENILGKLGFSSRTQIAAWAVSQGLAEPASDRQPA